MKEPKFKSHDDFIHHIQSYKPIRNPLNFEWFSMEKIGNKLHTSRWLLVQDVETLELKIKFYTHEPKHKVISYANVSWRGD